VTRLRRGLALAAALWGDWRAWRWFALGAMWRYWLWVHYPLW
jgi:hypothetical protein